MILYTLLPLLFHNIDAAEVTIISCEGYACDEGFMVSTPHNGGRSDLPKKCPEDGGKDWFSKILGKVPEKFGGTLRDFCVAQGYDAVGEVNKYIVDYRDARSDEMAEDEDSVLCNVRYSAFGRDPNKFPDYRYRWFSEEPVTFKCTNFMTTKAYCCLANNEEWHPACYATYGPFVNYQPCSDSGVCSSECVEEEGGSPASSQCENCCITNFGSAWNCVESPAAVAEAKAEEAEKVAEEAAKVLEAAEEKLAAAEEKVAALMAEAEAAAAELKAAEDKIAEAQAGADAAKAEAAAAEEKAMVAKLEADAAAAGRSLEVAQEDPSRLVMMWAAVGLIGAAAAGVAMCGKNDYEQTLN